MTAPGGGVGGVSAAGLNSAVNIWSGPGARWDLTFSPSFISFLERHGHKAAATQSPTSSAAGLKPGDWFAITFYGRLSANNSSASNALYGFAGYRSNFPQDPKMSGGWWILCNGQGASTVNYLPTDELWKYERGSYKGVTLYIAALQVPSPIQVVKDGKARENPPYT